MIGFLGHTALLAAFTLGVLGLVLGWAGGGRAAWARPWIPHLAASFAGAVLSANLLLEAGLLAHDFSISYVSQVGSLRSPAWISAVSLWSALDGSLLFWGLVLAGFIAAYAWRHREPTPEQATTLAILLGLGAGFALLSAVAANPFRAVFPPPPDGPGPNPLLQNHPLMAIHPPVLYAGFVGLAVPFAIAASALRAGRLDRDLLASLRGWLLAAWVLLTVGIALGGRWAYDVLGWGGYWSWDPVENASLLPWLTSTAALHALLVAQRREGARVYALALAMSGFALALLGTFLTRSGVVGSVHAFAPGAVGTALLVLFAAVLVFAVLLLAARAGAFASGPGAPWSLGREAGFFANNLVLALLTFAVLLGTLYPVALRGFTGAQTTVGEAFFDGVAAPLGIALLFLMGVGPALPWGAVAPARALRILLPPLGAGALAAGAAWILGARAAGLLAAVGGAGFAIAVSIAAMARPLLGSRTGEALAARIVDGRRRFGAHLAHVGIAVALVAVAASTSGRRTQEASLGRGEALSIGDYRLTFRGAQRRLESHRESLLAVVDVERGGESVGTLRPKLNRYFARDETLGTPAVRSTPREDLYLTLLSLDANRGRIALRAQVSPMIAWLWIGVGIVALGGLLALPRRRRAQAPAAATASAVAPRPARAGVNA